MTMINMLNDPIAEWLGMNSDSLTIVSIALRIGISFLLSAAIGWERSNKRHSAGLRTFILVSLSSTGAALLDSFLADTYSFAIPAISAATVIGIANISTYSILYSSRNQIRGLTTAVGLWGCCIIGLTLGFGLYTVALISFIALFACLNLMPTLEVYLKDRSNHFEIHLELKNKQNLQDFITTSRRLGLNIDEIESNPAYINSGLSVYSIGLTIVSPELKQYKTHSEIIEALRTMDSVSFIEEIR